MTPTVPALAALEAWLVATGTHAEGALAGALAGGRARELGVAIPEELERLVTAGPRLSALERLQIYNDGYHSRLVECVRDDYPALEFALGAETFAALARAYIGAHPSRSPVLDRYGAHFAAFCATRAEPWSAFARELARLEWALVEAVHAPASAALDPAELARVPPHELVCARFVPNASLRVLELDYPVNDFFQAFVEEREPEPPAPRRSAVAVTREGRALVRRTLDPLGATLLRQLVTGASLEQALLLVMRDVTDTDTALYLASSVQEWFAAWTSLGFFSALEVREPITRPEN